MSSSWLKEYVLEALGLEIRKASPRETETENETATVVATTRAAAATAAAATTTGRTSTTSQARLVQILGRGRGLESDTDATQRKPPPPGNDWWNVKSRGKSPNLAKHTNAWIVVSDGSHSVRLYLTIGALKEIFDWDNQNNNEDNLFGPGCCVLLKKYSFECDVDNDNNSVQLKVSSLEPKPGFNYHHGTNHDDNSSKAINRPVMEETDVLYGLQFLAIQRQQQMTNISSGTNNDSNTTTMNSAGFARDWDIAFGRLSKGRLTISTISTDEKAEVVVDRNRGLADVLELAEEAASTDEAIREWEMAKKEYGITSSSMNSANNDSNVHNTQKPMATTATKRADGQDGDHEDNDEDEEEEDLSRMYIQNVLATSDEGEGESENENEKALTSQKEYEGDDDGNLSSDSEEPLEPLLPETQPKNTTFIQPAEKEEKESGENIVETATKMSRKRPRENSFESGTASNLTLDEAITGPGSTKKSRSQMRRRRQQQQQQQQLPLHRQQEHSHNSTSIWESIKEQLFEPNRTILYCVPYCRIPSSNDINDDEKMLVTPKRSLTSKTFGSAASISTNFTASTPNPSSGAYYRKHGLARWLSQNAIDEERG